MPDRPLTATEGAACGPLALPWSARIDAFARLGHDPLMLVPPHDPARHELKEPPGAGFVWWTKETVKLAALQATHGHMLNGIEAARFLGVTRGRVMQLGQRGTLRRFPVGRHVFYALCDLRAWLNLRSEGKVHSGPGSATAPVHVEPVELALC